MNQATGGRRMGRAFIFRIVLGFVTGWVAVGSARRVDA
jgi:hypothetical protein